MSLVKYIKNDLFSTCKEKNKIKTAEIALKELKFYTLYKR